MVPKSAVAGEARAGQLVRIGNEVWDFVNAPGREVRVDPEVGPTAKFPTRWRVFGPLGPEPIKPEIPLHYSDEMKIEATAGLEAAVKKLTGIPTDLTVAGVTLKGRDVVMKGDTLDFDELFGGHNGTIGYQACAVAEMQIEEEVEVTFGAGANNKDLSQPPTRQSPSLPISQSPNLLVS